MKGYERHPATRWVHKGRPQRSLTRGACRLLAEVLRSRCTIQQQRPLPLLLPEGSQATGSPPYGGRLTGRQWRARSSRHAAWQAKSSVHLLRQRGVAETRTGCEPARKTGCKCRCCTIQKECASQLLHRASIGKMHAATGHVEHGGVVGGTPGEGRACEYMMHVHGLCPPGSSGRSHTRARHSAYNCVCRCKSDGDGRGRVGGGGARMCARSTGTMDSRGVKMAIRSEQPLR